MLKNIEIQVKEIVLPMCGGIADIGQLKEGINLAYYGIDSVNAVELVLNLEEEFGITIQEDEVSHLRTISTITSFIKTKVKKK